MSFTLYSALSIGFNALVVIYFNILIYEYFFSTSSISFPCIFIYLTELFIFKIAHHGLKQY